MRRQQIIGGALGLGATKLQAQDAEGIPHLAPNADAASFFSPNLLKDVSGGFLIFKFADDIYANANIISWTPKASDGQTLAPVVVPWGFVTDLTSVPRVFWSILPRDGKYAFAAVIHDYLYWIQDRPKPVADAIFDKAMFDLLVADTTRKTLALAVREFGDSAWIKNAKLKASGEKRILKSLPTSPLVRWSDWKTGNVF